MYKGRIILLLACLLCMAGLKATHNRAGEIVYKRIAPFSTVVAGSRVPVYHYSITVIRYTDHGAQIADRCEDTIHFGDGEVGVASRINDSPLGCNCGFKNGVKIGCGEIINSDPNHLVKLNIYSITHYYPGPGDYTISSFDPNRNEGIENIPNSVDLPFYLESKLIITAYSGANTSPQFAFAPIDKACLRQCFEHNPGAYDPDGDSLSYAITESRGVGGAPVPGYFYPPGSYGINPVTGELRWCSPSITGEYNLAFIVYEWRKNTNGVYQMIGYVLRDMQVIVQDCHIRQPPLAQVPPDTCVEAGTLVEKSIFITDADGHRVSVFGGGGPFEETPPLASLTNTESSTASGGFTSNFRWQTTCDHVRKIPYQVTIKVQDDDSPVNQVSFSDFNITVMPPSIKGLTATPAGTSIRISWNAPSCAPQGNPLEGYRVYRRNSCDSLPFSPCGPDLSVNGYSLIATVGTDSTFYVDSSNGDGLVVGQNYNYIVTGVYRDGSETFASTGVCSELKRDVPVLLHVDVDSTSATNGIIFTSWARPLKSEGNFDTLANAGPYTFRLIHKAPNRNPVAVFTSTAQQLYLLDTAFLHTGVNTVEGPHEYQVEFLAGGELVGSSQKANSIFLLLEEGDRRIELEWETKTPWHNEKYTIHRLDPGASTYSIVGATSGTVFTDTNNVRNGFNYCYWIESEGAYSDPGIFRPLINKSQIQCMKPVDKTPPCTPTVTLEADCPGGFVRISWSDVAKECHYGGDIEKYTLYHKKTVNGEYIQVVSGTMINYEVTGLAEVSGCYAVQALDTNGNSTPLSPPFCIDNCPIFELPNVFTPNDDGSNDVFKAIRVRQIKEINLIIVDRWGNKIYETTDPYFNWNGVSSITNVPCNEGSYFYVCDVFEPRLTGIVKRTLRGSVHLAR